MTGLLNEMPFLKSFAQPSAFVPSWLKELRAKDEAALLAMPILSVRDEEWKYTSLEALWWREFSLSPVSRDVSPAFQEKLIPGAINVLLYNGHYLGEISGDVPDGIKFLSGQEAFKSLSDDSQYFSAVTANDTPLFTMLNRSFFENPLVVQVSRGAQIKPLVHLIHVVSKQASAIFPRVKIRLDQAASLSVLETLASFSEGRL